MMSNRVMIRTARSSEEIIQSIETWWANDGVPDPARQAGDLAHWQTLFTNYPEGFWIAEDESSGQIVGVAAAVRRPPQWVLANFFVRPEAHGQGIGKTLLAKAYAATNEGCNRFAVHASQHPSAQTLYIQLGMYPLPYSIVFAGHRENRLTSQQALTAEEQPVENIQSLLNTFDQAALGFTRPRDHEWWSKGGSYYLLKADAHEVGYFRVSAEGILGPLVVSNDQWMIEALDLAIQQQSALSAEDHNVFVPGQNRAAIQYLTACGYRLKEIELLLSSHPMPGLANVIFHDTDFL
jgi:GNAT superfamily N-acetyltransferase